MSITSCGEAIFRMKREHSRIRESLAHTYAGMDSTEVARMVGGNAAHVYGFDLHKLAPLAAQLGPEVDMVRAGIHGIPETSSLAFEPRSATVS